MTQEEFSRRFEGSAVMRTRMAGLLRNVAEALGYWGSPEAVPALAAALSDEEPLVRVGTGARQALRTREEVEEDGGGVGEEITRALGE